MDDINYENKMKTILTSPNVIPVGVVWSKFFVFASFDKINPIRDL